jgi:hypothetical protein
MSNIHEFSALAKDAFVVLQGAIEIKYRDGDIWRPEEGQVEHPLAPRLRAASMASMLTDPPDVERPVVDGELIGQLREERRANDAFRNFLVELETICHGKGMPRDVVGPEVLTWIKNHVTK